MPKQASKPLPLNRFDSNLDESTRQIPLNLKSAKPLTGDPIWKDRFLTHDQSTREYSNTIPLTDSSTIKSYQSHGFSRLLNFSNISTIPKASSPHLPQHSASGLTKLSQTHSQAKNEQVFSKKIVWAIFTLVRVFLFLARIFDLNLKN